MQNVNRVNDISSTTEQQTDNKLSGEQAFENIIEQHAIDAAFLWLLRSQVVQSSTLYNHQDIHELDQRIAGHLEALLSVKHTGWKVCVQQLEFEEAGETFVAAFMAFHSGDAKKIKTVCEAALDNESMFPGLVSALGWIQQSTAEFWIQRFLSVSDCNYQYLGISACSIRGMDPLEELTRVLQAPSTNQHSELYSRCLRLVGELKRADLIPSLNQAIEHDDKVVTFWAIWSSILLGNHALIELLKPYILEDNPHKDSALQLIFNVLPVDKARLWISEISKDLNQNNTVIFATGILGDPHAVPWLIQQMNKLLYARLAGQSFALITGLDLNDFKLDKDVDLAFKENPDGDIEDDAEQEDSDLPWPDTAKVQMFWQQHGNTLQIGQRYFLGQPISPEILDQAVQLGNQLQRSFAVLKMALLNQQTPLINIATPTVNI